jgi:hypothetical protein
VGVCDGSLRDKSACAEEVPGGGNVIAGFVPEVGEAEEAKVREVDADEEERIEHPERDVGGRLLGVGSCSA